jgi:hypothetical protein
MNCQASRKIVPNADGAVYLCYNFRMKKFYEPFEDYNELR